MTDKGKPNSLPIFEKILKAAEQTGNLGKKTLSALDWFRNKASQARAKIEDLRLVREYYKNAIFPTDLGQIYVFEYKPKGIKTLPYYDQFPIVLILHETPNGFVGLNFHYLPPRMRAELFQQLLKLEVVDTATQTEKIKVKYQLLASYSRYKYFRPCIKRYILTRIGKMFVKIYPHEWETALFLPTEKFIGATKEQVWEDSRAIVKKYDSKGKK